MLRVTQLRQREVALPQPPRLAGALDDPTLAHDVVLTSRTALGLQVRQHPSNLSVGNVVRHKVSELSGRVLGVPPTVLCDHLAQFVLGYGGRAIDVGHDAAERVGEDRHLTILRAELLVLVGHVGPVAIPSSTTEPDLLTAGRILVLWLWHGDAAAARHGATTAAKCPHTAACPARARRRASSAGGQSAGYIGCFSKDGAANDGDRMFPQQDIRGGFSYILCGGGKAGENKFGPFILTILRYGRECRHTQQMSRNMPRANCYLHQSACHRSTLHIGARRIIGRRQEEVLQARSGPLGGADGPNLHQP